MLAFVFTDEAAFPLRLKIEKGHDIILLGGRFYRNVGDFCGGAKFLPTRVACFTDEMIEAVKR